MKPSLVEDPHFKEEVKRLKRKYPHFEADLQRFYEDFLNNPLQRAYAIPGFERKLWKIRMRSTDLQRGKSGGFRLIFYFNESKPDTVHLLAVYPKTEREDLTRAEYLELYKRILKPPS